MGISACLPVQLLRKFGQVIEHPAEMWPKLRTMGEIGKNRAGLLLESAAANFAAAFSINALTLSFVASM